MAILLEKRVRKLETAVGLGRCSNPEHKFMLWVGPEQPAENEAKIESMRQCLKCRDKRIIIFQTNVPEEDED